MAREVGPAHRDAHPVAEPGERPHDMAAEETRPADDRDELLRGSLGRRHVSVGLPVASAQLCNAHASRCKARLETPMKTAESQSAGAGEGIGEMAGPGVNFVLHSHPSYSSAC